MDIIKIDSKITELKREIHMVKTKINTTVIFSPKYFNDINVLVEYRNSLKQQVKNLMKHKERIVKINKLISKCH